MLVNKQGIVDAELQTFPWEHILVDNFIEENTFNELLKIADHIKSIESTFKDSIHYVPEYNECVFNLKHLIQIGVDPKVVELYAKVLDDIKKLKTTIWDKFSDHRHCEEDKTYCNGHVNWTGSGGHYQIHPDSHTKSVSIIVYFDPDENNTTTLWGKPGVESTCVRPEWKRNRAVVFCPNKSTWHSVDTTPSNRMTLACFIEFVPDDRSSYGKFSVENIRFGKDYSVTQLRI